MIDTSLIPFILYFVIITGIGMFSYRYSARGIKEFFIGGRQMNRFVVALSTVVSGRSAWLLMGVTGYAFLNGISAIWMVIGYIVVEFFLLLYYAPRIRNFSEKHDCITIPDFYAARFNDRTGILRIMLVFIFCLFMITYISAQFVAGGKAFASHFGINESMSLFITAGIVLLYTLIGGFLAVSLTDVFQAFMMLIALLLLPILAILNIGSIGTAFTRLSGMEGELLNAFKLNGLVIGGLLSIGLGSPGNPHILVRYMAIDDPKQFKWTAVVATLWNILMAAGTIGIGLLARIIFKSRFSLTDQDKENAFVDLTNHLLSPFWAGIFIAALFAAIMSTCDSQLLVAASSIVRDFYQKLYKKNKDISTRKLTVLSRWVILFLVVLAIVLGLIIKEQIVWFVLFAWGGLGASIGPTSILALFWKRTTLYGVLAGLLSGTVTLFVWKLGGLSGYIYELVPAFVISSFFTVVVSLLTPKRKA